MEPLEYVEGEMFTASGRTMKAFWLAQGDEVICCVTEGAGSKQSAAAMKYAAHCTKVMPDLLEACKAAVEELHGYADSGGSVKAAHLCDMLRAAIAKATK